MEKSYSSTYGGGSRSAAEARRAPVSQTAAGPARPVQAKVEELAEQARDQVKGRLGQEKKRASRGLNRVANALRSSGQHLNEEDQEKLGSYARQAADWVEEFSGYLQDHEVDDLFREVENFGRRRPELFVGGAFLLGFMAARFFKSSSTQSDWEEEEPAPATGYADHLAGGEPTAAWPAGPATPGEAWHPAPAPAESMTGTASSGASVPPAAAHVANSPTVLSGESLAAITPPSGAGAEGAVSTGMTNDDLDDTEDVVANPGTASRRSRG